MPPKKSNADAMRLLEGLNDEQSKAVRHWMGPVLVSASAGAGKCVTPDTLVWSDGLRTMGEAWGSSKIAGPHGTAEVVAWYDDGKRVGHKVTLECGVQIDATPAHRVWTRNDAGVEGWKHVGKLTQEDYVAVARGEADFGTISLDDEEAYLLGLVVADGFFGHSGIQIDKQRPVLERVLPIVDRWRSFCNVRLGGRRRPIRIFDKSSYHAVISTGGLGMKEMVADRYGYVSAYSHERSVPTSVLRGTRRTVQQFLRGYFDGDGYCDKSPAVSTASQTLAKQVFAMVSGLGVYCRLRQKKTPGLDAYIVEIRDMSAFDREISFTNYGLKKDNAFREKLSATRNTNIDIIPGTAALFKRAMSHLSWKEKCGHYHLFNGSRRPSYDAIQSRLPLCADGPEKKELERLLSERRAWSRVESVKRSVAHRIDCEVAEQHAFVGNGIINHNTGVVTKRVAYLHAAYGVDPRRVLPVTFTKKGAGEMEERITKLLGAKKCTVGTFHKLCRSILSKDFPGFSDWNPERIGSADKRYEIFVKNACGHQNMNWKGFDLARITSFVELAKADGAEPYSPRAIEIAESRYEATGDAIDNPQKVLEAYDLAESMRRSEPIMTFADWMVETAKLLRNDENIRKRWAEKWDYLIIDEAQDNSLVQNWIVEALARDHRNVMAVGDEKQSVFAFRGASPTKFTSFPSEWNAPVLSIGRNYRSAGVIIDAANAITDAMDSGLKLHMVADRPEVGRLTIRQYANQEDEGTAVATQIREAHEAGEPWSDSFVLYRTRAMSRACEEAFMRAKIPYHVVGGSPFYERAESKALIAYLKVAARRANTSQAIESLKAPFRYLGRNFFEAMAAVIAKPPPEATWTKVANLAALQAGLYPKQIDAVAAWGRTIDNVRSMIDEGIGPAMCVNTIVRETQFLDWLTKDEGRETVENDRVTIVAEFIRAAHQFKSVEAFLAHIVEANEAAKAAQEDTNEDRVTLLTIHASKGLEKKNVFLIMCNAGILPHARAEDVSEELRLFYVAVTRARDNLHISSVKSAIVRDVKRTMYPSEHIELVRWLAEVAETDEEAPLVEPEPKDEELEDEENEDNDWARTLSWTRKNMQAEK